MQDINQQLYENKSTPEGFIPVYGYYKRCFELVHIVETFFII